MGLRITLLGIVLLISYASLSANLYNLQIRKGEDYGAKAVQIYNSSRALEAPRGDIYITDKDKDFIQVAINKDYPIIFSDNTEIEDPDLAAGELSEIIGRPESELADAFKKEGDIYEPILKRATKEQTELVRQKKIKGVYVSYENARFYPFGALASHVLGYVSTDSATGKIGLYGVEKLFDKSLGGATGSVNGAEIKKPIKGDDLYLTIDRNIQVQSELVLSDLVNNYGAVGGTVIVENPRTGEILAMASYPAFDPNDYGSFKSSFLNPAVQAIYEPGSVMKVITMAAGIDSGKITPETTYVDTGRLVINGKPIHNVKMEKYGRITMKNVIEHSVNTGAVFAQRAMGHDIFYDYLSKFGFKRLTGIDLPGEVTGGLNILEKNARDVNFATASFGQGIAMTPISLVSAISAIANHGIMMKPYITVGEGPRIQARVISEETSRKVVDMMVSAVNKNIIAAINNYNVAGKTGTAQVPDFKKGGYTDQVINTYVGFAPAYDPKFVIFIKLDKPAGALLAGQTVVPAFKELAEFILNYYSVPPDNIEQK